MASIRSLKKEINFEITSFIDECYDIMIGFPENEEDLNEVIDGAVDLYDQVIAEVNAAGDVVSKSAYFSELETKFYDQMASLRNKLAQLESE
ncbi:MAG TPA: hypothetical protein DDX92_13200 [Flavobacteriales bacterium]|jgi:hypothetical protein|nr:hypothetical protein [Flavobacteriales bacterium]